MWSNVILSEQSVSPPSRYKHSCVLVPTANNYTLYLYGGRSGTFPLKDFWRLDLKSGRWDEIKTENSEENPPYLQEHSIIHHENNLYIFGGEISFSYGEDLPPLWIYHIPSNSWRRWGQQEKKKFQLKTPVGRRGHTAIAWNEYMLLYGGYRDLKGSLGDLWAFHFETESWHMFSSSEKPPTRGLFSFFTTPTNAIAQSTPPPARHSHVSVLNKNTSNLYIHGGMNDLTELSDLWKFDLNSRRWTQIRSKPSPGPIHSHVGISALNSLLIMTGERAGKPIDNEFWRFDYHGETWEKISFNNCCRPCPRTSSWAGIIIPCQQIEENVAMPTSSKRKPSVFSQFLNAPMDYQALSESNSVCLEEESDTPDLLIDFDNHKSTRRSESANCLQNNLLHKNQVKKSASVRFADNNCTSDYSSMENGFENPNYHRNLVQQEFEMGTLGAGNCPDDNEEEIPTASASSSIPQQHHSYMLLIGGNESHSSQVVKKPLSIWRLRVTNQLFAVPYLSSPTTLRETTTGF